VRSVLVLLRKDARVLARSPLLLTALVVYPLLIAVLVGLVVRYAGERPRVALVDEGGLPGVLVIGDRSFHLQERFEQAKEVELVRMPAGQANDELRTGEVLAALVVPDDFASELRGLRESPRIVLRTTKGGLGTRVVEKVRSLVYTVNLELQQAYIDANLAALELVLRGGSGTIGETRFSLLGLRNAERELLRLEASGNPAVRTRAKQLRQFVQDLRGAVEQVGDFLRATANPVQLVTESRSGRTWILSAQAQAYALALALAFVTILLGAAAITSEREEHVLGRLVRGLVSLRALLAEKVVLVTLVGALLGLLLAVVFGLIVEVGGVSGGQPWSRLPLLALGLALAGLSFGAFGVLLGTLAREAGTATLIAFLLALPVTLIGLVPESVTWSWLAGLSPFGHAVRLFTSALYDAHPARSVVAEGAWLLGLGTTFVAGARLGARRLVE